MKYEYRVESVTIRSPLLQTMLNVRGQDGWELISTQRDPSVHQIDLIFKRQIEPTMTKGGIEAYSNISRRDAKRGK